MWQREMQIILPMRDVCIPQTEHSFYWNINCNYISNVVLPASVTSIAADAFTGSNVQSVTIPASVTSIGFQSNWAPDIVYGYTGSVAEAWADENNYIFEALDGGSGNTQPQDSDDDDDGDDSDDSDDDDDDDGYADGDGNETTTVSGSSAPTVTAAGVQAAHIKDATPKTGVEEYGIFFLFGAILLVGGGLFAFSKKMHCEK